MCPVDMVDHGDFVLPMIKEHNERFGIVVGPARQALLDSVAMLAGVRVWHPRWCNSRMQLRVRNDSMVALGAWAMERSSNT